MKGLLTKDLLILKNMNRSGLIIVLLYAMYLFLGMETFALSFTAIMMVIFCGSTISYDEFDNGFVYLFTMPFTRKQYVQEKYLLLFGSSAIGTTVIFAIILLVKALGFSHVMLEDLIPTYIATIFLCGFMSSVLIPFQLKYGSEKGRGRLFIAMAVIVVATVTFARIAPQPFLKNLADFLDSLPIVGIIGGIVVALLIMIGISYNISQNVMRKKEF